jgi:hypothetical protein
VGLTVFRREDSSIAFTGRLKGKLYLVDFPREKVDEEGFVILMKKGSSMNSPLHKPLNKIGL